MATQPARYMTKKLAFGSWLLARDQRGDWIDDLVRDARRDPLFPRDGDVEAVRLRIVERGADGDMLERLDDAELDYLAH